jgi:hypothetical protein
VTHTGQWKQLAMSRNGNAILMSTFCWVLATAQESDRVSIPHTPLTKQELDEYKVEVINDHGWSKSTAEEFVPGASSEHFRFTDDDFRKAFPKILPSDKQESLCSTP